jgi:hypothetical protein
MLGPEKHSKVEFDQEEKDCLQCRLVGTGTLVGLSLYANHLRMSTPKGVVGHRVFHGSLAIGSYVQFVHILCSIHSNVILFLKLISNQVRRF